MKPQRVPWAELLLSAICLWAAWYHTPAGALLRLVFGSRSRPLLSYYGAGATAAAGGAPAPPALKAPVPPAEALAVGAWVVQGGKLPETKAQLAALEKRFGSEQAAVLALFAGDDAARYAADTAGAGASLEELARTLPPRYADRIALASRALTLGGAYSLAWPLPPSTPITSGFGMRLDPLLGVERLHAGVDLGVPEGTTVRATGAGVVRRASFDGSNGGMLMLDHGRGVVTVYCHNDELLVSDGDRVERGQPISRSGNTGRSTGPHLHYQLDLLGQAADPLRYRGIPARAAKGGVD